MMAGSAGVASVCSGCKGTTCVDPSGGTVEGPCGSRGGVTYVDTDIVVWDCPACGSPNAEELRE
jgi:hypothetical protein